MDFSKAVMHRVPTYEEIIRETITHPTDKIALPDRMATQLRGLPQLTRFDDNEASLDLGADQEKIQKERARAVSLNNLAPSDTFSVERAASAKRSRTTPSQPPEPPPPPASSPQQPGGTPMAQTYASPGVPRSYAPPQAPDPYYGVGASSSSGPKPPPPSPPMTASSSFQTNIQERIKSIHAHRQTEMNVMRADAERRQKMMKHQIDSNLKAPTSVAQGYITEQGPAPPPTAPPPAAAPTGPAAGPAAGPRQARAKMQVDTTRQPIQFDIATPRTPRTPATKQTRRKKGAPEGAEPAEASSHSFKADVKTDHKIKKPMFVKPKAKAKDETKAYINGLSNKKITQPAAAPETAPAVGPAAAPAGRRRLTGKQTDRAGLFVAPTIPVKRRLTGKQTDTAGIFVAPEEQPPKRRRLRGKQTVAATAAAPPPAPARAVRRKLVGKQTDTAGVFIPPSVPVKRKLVGKQTDTAGIFVAPEEPSVKKQKLPAPSTISMAKVIPYIQKALDGGDLNQDQKATFARIMEDIKESGKKRYDAAAQKTLRSLYKTTVYGKA